MAGKYALIIATTHYDDPSVSGLSTPDVDLRALEDVLKNPDVARFDEVIVLVDEGCAAVRKAIVRFFGRRRSDDLILLYFAGHALKDERGDLFLALRDTSAARLAETAIESAFVGDQMDRILSTRLVLVLDCHQNSRFEIGPAFEGLGGRVILTATDVTPSEREGDQVVGDGTSSCFTHFLIEGLETGAADRDGDGAIIVDELYDYISEHVSASTPHQALGKWTYGQREDIVLAKHPMASEPVEGRSTNRLVLREGPAPPTDADRRRRLDENVQFSVYRPPIVVPERWYPMLVFAHLSARRPDAPASDPDPIADVQRQAQQILGDDAAAFGQVRQDSRLGIPLDGHLRIVPLVPGIEFNPPGRSFLWTEPVHREEFRLRARREADGTTARGTVSIYLDSVLVADVSIAIAVKTGALDAPAPLLDVARPYRRIFASYSHRDAAVVRQFEEYARGFGDRYMRDVIDLRAGEVWDRRLAEMIEDADVFQLFWSWNSMRSPFVRAEWEHAAKMNRAYFVRPVYWETPFPQRGSLPTALRSLHFANVGTVVGAPQATVPPAPAPRPPMPPAAAPRGPMPSAPDSRATEPPAATPDEAVLVGRSPSTEDTAAFPQQVEKHTRGLPASAWRRSLLPIWILVVIVVAFVLARACFSS